MHSFLLGTDTFPLSVIAIFAVAASISASQTQDSMLLPGYWPGLRGKRGKSLRKEIDRKPSVWAQTPTRGQTVFDRSFEDWVHHMELPFTWESDWHSDEGWFTNRWSLPWYWSAYRLSDCLATCGSDHRGDCDDLRCTGDRGTQRNSSGDPMQSEISPGWK